MHKVQENNVRNAVMYHSYRPLRDLNSDDIFAIQQIYDAKRENRWETVSSEYVNMIARQKAMIESQMEHPRTQNYFQSS